jgi:Predicted integral membrane protein (DUF2269)
MEWLGTLFLYLHIGGSIVAFGPTIAFPLIGARAAKEPMHGNFALRVNYLLVERVVEPGAAFVFLMGIGLIITRGWNPFTELWLLVGIVLFLVVFFYNLLVQLPRTNRMIALTSGPPPEGASGPPPEFVEEAGNAARGGMLSTLGLFIILALMVFKPF